MSEANLQALANFLDTTFTSANDYANWLDTGVRGIVMDGESALTAFEYGDYIIGAEPDAWEKDIRFIHNNLSAKRKALFSAGLASCLDRVGPDPHANNPGREGGRNLERLALSLLSIARDIRAVNSLRCLPNLIQSKFPRSQAVYDSALFAWRVMAYAETENDWHEIFCPNENRDLKEIRFRHSYSPLIAFGMCVAHPEKRHYFLNEWRPLQSHLLHLQEPDDLDPAFGSAPEQAMNQQLEKFRRIVDSMERIRGNLPTIHTADSLPPTTSLQQPNGIMGGGPPQSFKRVLKKAVDQSDEKNLSLVDPNDGDFRLDEWYGELT